MIDSNPVIFDVKIVVVESLVLETVEFDRNNMHTEIVLIE